MISLSALSDKKRSSIEQVLEEKYLSDLVVVIDPNKGMTVNDYKRDDLDVIKSYMFPLTNTSNTFNISYLNYYHVLGVLQYVKDITAATDVKFVLLNWKDEEGVDRCELIKFVSDIASRVDSLVNLSLLDNRLTMRAIVNGKDAYDSTLSEFNKLVLLSSLEYPYSVLLRRLNKTDAKSTIVYEHILNFLLEICKQYLSKEEGITSEVSMCVTTHVDKISFNLTKDTVKLLKFDLDI